MSTGLATARTLRTQAIAWAEGAEALRSLIEARLDALTAARGRETVVESAARYALLAPGKRIRPILALLAANQFGAPNTAALDGACAIEMVHTASLILDDLPCMDDAKLRRGRPATHCAFGEAPALLAAMALLNRAFAVMADAQSEQCPKERLAQISRLSAAIGAEGLIGGQEADLGERRDYDRCEEVDALNHRKTGVLFALALEMGARSAGAAPEAIAAMREAGVRLGLAFQTLDDILDKTGAADALGKDANKDADKPSIASLEGLEAARLRAQREVEAALQLAAGAGGSVGPLRDYLECMFAAALD